MPMVFISPTEAKLLSESSQRPPSPGPLRTAITSWLV